MTKLRVLVRFARPHTIIATSFQVGGLFVLAGGHLAAGGTLLAALLASLLANVYIVGLNQLVDVEIDRINKPALPLAAGDLTRRQGQRLVAIAGGLAIGLAVLQGLFLALTVGLAMLIGTFYSLEPWRLKRRPIWAALSIASVRGLLVNVGLFLHFHQRLRPGEPLSWPLIGGLALFFFGFGLVIALYKDIPDLIGDRQYGIRTFTVRLGPEWVFRLGRWLLTGFYLLPVVAAVLRLPGVDGLVLLVTHLIMLTLFWSVSWGVNPAEKPAIGRFYMFLWNLFYAEYALLGLQAIVRPV